MRTTGDVAFNRFVNLDSIEDRIINYLINSTTKNAERIWKLLKYGTLDALMKENLTREEKSKLIYRGEENQTDKRIFMQSYLDDSFTVQCSLLKFYIDSVVPVNHLRALVNIGVDIMSHSKIQVVYNDSMDDIENPETYRDVEKNIVYKNRNTVLLKCILAELNGAEIEGVGQLQFNQQLSPFNQSRSGIFDNKNYNGSKNILVVQMSGVSQYND